jgi:hypothetical protein
MTTNRSRQSARESDAVRLRGVIHLFADASRFELGSRSMRWRLDCDEREYDDISTRRDWHRWREPTDPTPRRVRPCNEKEEINGTS